MTDNNNSSEGDIDRLTAELEELTIRCNKIDRRRSNVAEQLRALRGQPNKYTLYKPLNIIANRVDSQGNPLCVNDTIRFNTPEVQRTSKGTVKGFGKRFVKCVDKQGFLVNKEPKSITRTNLQQEDTEQ